MTTAPTPEEVRALAERLEHCVAKWGKQNALSLEAYSAVKMMRRLQAENERLQQLLQCDTPRYCSSVQRCTAGDEQQAELEVRKPLPLSDAEIIAAQESLARSRARIGLPCSRCESGKYRADSNAYHDFHRCDSCLHVPMWGEDGKEIGPPTCVGESS